MVHLVYFCVIWIKYFPATQGISRKISPHEIVLERSLIFERDAKVIFGLYAETKKDAVITNKNRGRTFLGILLGTTVNIQGTQNFIDIKTGAIKKCRTIQNLPIPQAVIKFVHYWEKRSAREENRNKMEFLYRNK